jgi:hypothetical protein
MWVMSGFLIAHQDIIQIIILEITIILTGAVQLEYINYFRSSIEIKN